MKLENITLTDGKIPHRFLDELGVKEKEPVTAIHSKIGIVLIKHSYTLTNLLAHMVKTKHHHWDESEYPQQLLKRSE